jgi:hypothetical protein
MDPKAQTALYAAAAMAAPAPRRSIASILRASGERKINWLKISLRGQDRSRR